MPISILIIDDEPRVLRAFARSLRLGGYTVFTADSGADGLALYHQEQPEIVITDLRMPEMTGQDVLQAIRAHDPEANVILTSGHGDQDAILEAMRAGASDFLPKPVDQVTLESALRRAAERVHLKRELRASRAALRQHNARLEEEVAKRTAELRQTTQRFQALLDHSPALVHIFDEEGRYLLVGKATAEAMGLAREEIIGKTFADFLPPETVATFMRRVERLKEDRAVLSVEDQITVNGEERFFESLLFPLSEEDGVATYAAIATEVTARKQAEEALEEERAFLSTVLENIEEAIIICDAEGRIIRFNEAARRLHGVPEAPIPPEKWSAYYDLYQADGVTPLLTEKIPLFRALQGEHVRDAEIVVNPAHSEPRSLVCSGQALTDAAGEITSAVVTMHDITERKRAEEALRESEERFRKSFNTEVVAIAISRRRDGMYIEANPGFLKVTGYDYNEIVGHTSQELEFLSSSQRQTLIANLEEKGRLHNQELTYPTRSGELRTILFSIGPITIGNEDCMLATMVDITERKQMEEALRASEEQHRRLFETMSVGVVYHQAADGTIISANPAAERLLGLSLAQMRGKTTRDPRWKMILEDGAPVPGSDHPAMIALRTGEQVGPVTRGIYIPERDAYVWLSITAIPLFQPGAAHPFQVYATFDDITERKRMEAALRESEEQFRALVEGAPEAIFVQTEHRFAYLNPAAVRLFGAETADQLIGQPVLDRFHPSVRDQAQQRIHALNQEKREVPILEEIYLRMDGSPVDVEVATVPITYEGQDGALVFVRDITQRKQSTAALQHWQELMEFIIKHDPNAIAVLDKDLRFKFVSDRFVRDYQIGDVEIIGRHHYEVFPEIPQKWREVHRRVLDGEILRAEEDYFIRPDGSKDWTRWECRPWYLADQTIGGLILYTEVITERKRAEKSLLESERRFQRMLEVVPDMISIHSPDMDILYSNWQGFAAVPEDKRLPNTKCYRTYRGLDKICPDCRAGSVLETRKPFQQEFQLPDGTWVDLRAIPILDQDHNVEMFMEWVRDITERKQAEEALRRSEERFRRAIAGAPFPAMIHAEDGEVLMLNAAWTQVTGYRHDEIPTIAAWAERAYGARQGAMRAVIAELYTADGHTDEGDFEIRCRDGATRIWTFRSTPLDTDETGRRLGLSMAVDITEQVYAREKRERLAAQVAAQARQLQAILDTVPQGVLLLDDAGRILHTNLVAEKDLVVLAGAQAGDALTHLGERPLVELLTSPPTKGLWHEIEVGARIFEAIARPVENGPAPEQWVLVIKDVTEERQIRAQIQQQAQLAAVGQLAAGIAHDFNNIMAVVVLYTQMGLNMPDVPPKLRARLEVVSQQARRATDLIQQILDFGRQAVLERRPMDLAPFLKEVVKLLERTLPENIKVKLNYDRDAYTVDADPTQMQQAIMNLAINARDAMHPQGGGELRIDLSRIAAPDSIQCVTCGQVLDEDNGDNGEWIRIAVTDNGSGIPPEALPHIFEPFFTTKEVGEGTGLGLSQVFGLVKQHEGHIDVTSQVGRGTTFTIYLPASQVRPSTSPAIERGSLIRGQGETVLVVEDNAALRAAMIDTLELLNYQVLPAANGRAALAVLEQHADEIAVVLSDLVMPEMGGQALFHAMRQRGLTLPVVMLSGHPMECELEALQAQGLAGWMLKPLDGEQLAQLLAQVLDKESEPS